MKQETTYTELTKISGNQYLVLGFDTAHSYNSSSDDFNYVFTETKKILDLVNNY